MWSCSFFPKLQLHFGRMWNFTNTYFLWSIWAKFFFLGVLPNTFEHSPCNYCQLIWLHTVCGTSHFVYLLKLLIKEYKPSFYPIAPKLSYDTISNTSSLDSIPFVLWNEAGLSDLGGLESGLLLCVHVSIIINTVCKSDVSVWTYTSKLFTLALLLCINIFITFTFTWDQCKYLSNTFTQSCVNVLRHVTLSESIIYS